MSSHLDSYGRLIPSRLTSVSKIKFNLYPPNLSNLAMIWQKHLCSASTHVLLTAESFCFGMIFLPWLDTRNKGLNRQRGLNILRHYLFLFLEQKKGNGFRNREFCGVTAAAAVATDNEMEEDEEAGETLYG